MDAETRQIAFTNRQWRAYQFVLNFHQLHRRTPSARELGRGLNITVGESAKLICSLTTKGILERRVYHVLAAVPPSYERQNFATACTAPLGHNH